MTSGIEWHLSRDRHANRLRQGKSRHGNIRSNSSVHQPFLTEDYQRRLKGHSLDHPRTNMLLRIPLNLKLNKAHLNLDRLNRLEMVMVNKLMDLNLTPTACQAQHHTLHCRLMLASRSPNLRFDH